MNLRRIGGFIPLTVMLAMPLLMSGTLALARGLDDASGEELAKIIRGGLLYDSWFVELGVAPPKETHPAYAKSKGKGKGAGTWRCKECHGWDYMGKEGAYKKGRRFTGIAGIRGAAGGSAAAVVKSLQGSDHELGGRIPAADLTAIARFVTEAQLSVDEVIDRNSKKARGDLAKGQRIYATVCAKCHGADGKKVNFGDEKAPEYVGTVANENPWETLHKIRFGQPGEEMPSLIAFPVQVQVDVLAYAQTLPAK
ncbi:MAG: c-type cytochrome [Candidatus Lambdaproteobacteria bacterium]|nr:c-type cytochrome [Candidatus Lambdaproteobacteria bacterium]